MRLMFTVWSGNHGERTPYEDLFIAGAELGCRQHAETLASYGHEVTFACFGPRDRSERVDGVQLEQRRHPLTGKNIDWREFWTEHFEGILDDAVTWQIGLMDRHQIDAVYTRVLWPTGVLGHRLQQATGVPCAATVDDKVFVEQLLDGPNLLPGSVRDRWAGEMRNACQGVQRLILLARHLETEIRRFTPTPADWALIGSGLDLNRFANIEPVDWRKRLTTEPHRVLLICAARLDWPKRQDVLIEAVAQLIADGRKLDLILLGTGKEQEHLTTLAAELGIVGHVHFLGYQPNEVVPASLLGADVICTPTDWEAFPIQLLEGLATGKPMIASDAPPYNDLLANQDLIPLCPNEPAAWTSALREVIDKLSDDALTAKRKTFIDQFLAPYTQDATSRAIEAVLAELCNACTQEIKP